MTKQEIQFLIEVLQRADCSTGYCCCGSAIEVHTFGDGHSPVDQGNHCQSAAIAILVAELSAKTQEPIGYVIRTTGEYHTGGNCADIFCERPLAPRTKLYIKEN